MAIYTINRNAEGYIDPTAGSAIKNIMESEKIRMKEFEINNGDIFEVENQAKGTGFYVVIASHEETSIALKLNDFDSNPIQVVCKGLKYTNPERISYICNKNIVNYVRSMTNAEFEEIVDAVKEALGFEKNTQHCTCETHEVEKPQERFVEPPLPFDCDSEELIKAKTERDIYKTLYETILYSLVKR